MSKDGRLQTLTLFLQACETREPDAILACFERGARMVDPLGTYEGHKAIRGYFEAIYKELASLSFETGPVCWNGTSCAVSWKGGGRRHDGSAVSYQGVDVFSFGRGRRLTTLWAFWAPEELLGAGGK
jgi:hypothetical protein